MAETARAKARYSVDEEQSWDMTNHLTLVGLSSNHGVDISDKMWASDSA